MATTYSITSGTYEYTVFIASAGEDAVTVASGSPIFYNCIFISDDATGLVNQSVTATYRNCIMKGSVADATSSEDISLTSSHNCFASGAVPANFGTTGNKTADPDWKDEAGGNYRLSPGSPCIRAGVDVGLTTDLYGVSFGSPPSMGVAEYYSLPIVYLPVILIEIQLDSGTVYVSTHDYYLSGQKYRGVVVPKSVSITNSMTDLFYGISTPPSFSFSMTNIDDGVNLTWDEQAAIDEFRGRLVKVGVYSDLDGYQFVAYGRINEFEIGDTVQISCDNRNKVLDTLIPRNVIATHANTGAFHATALDVGNPINICFGRCRDVPLYNIRNDLTLDYYDYLIGYGTIQGINEVPATGRGVKRMDQNLQLVTDTYYIYDGAAWIRGSGGADEAVVYGGGYAFIRFFQEQLGHTGPCKLWADVLGLELGGASCNRNFVTCLQNFLTNTTWGLSQDIDAATFTAAATETAAYLCDGAVLSQQRAEDIINHLLFPIRASIELNTNNEWKIILDKAGSSVLVAGDNDGRYNNCRVQGGLKHIPADQVVSKLTLHYDLRPRS